MSYASGSTSFASTNATSLDPGLHVSELPARISELSTTRIGLDIVLLRAYRPIHQDVNARCFASGRQVSDEEAAAMTNHRIGSREEWQAAREELLQREKEHTRMGDELARQRRDALAPVEKEYRFETDEGIADAAGALRRSLPAPRLPLMFGPSYEAGCPTCSSSADAVNGVPPHLHARDVTMLYVSRAAGEAPGLQTEDGLELSWVSSSESDFNFDFGVSRTEEQVREHGTDPRGRPSDHPAQRPRAGRTPGYLTEGPGMSAFAQRTASCTTRTRRAPARV